MKFETFNFFIIHIFVIQNVEDNILVKKRNFYKKVIKRS